MNILRRLCQHPIHYVRSQCFLHVMRNATTTSSSNEEEVALNVEDEEERAIRDAEIEKKRNKSRLYPDHYALYHGQNPYPKPVYEYHNSLRYKRRTYGMYGESSGVDPSVLWPTKEELAYKKEYESLAHPLSVHEMIDQVKKQKEDEAKAKRAREQDVAMKVLKIEQWKTEFYAKIQKKATEAALAKEKKDRLVEEIRRHFGFKIDPKDERFKEMMEKKEKEAKKLSKVERQKTRDMKLLAEAQAAEEKAKKAALIENEEEEGENEKNS